VGEVAQTSVCGLFILTTIKIHRVKSLCENSVLVHVAPTFRWASA